ncbi:inhibitor of the pro-sigma K processing machinery [Caloramator quimbayensis]|uniref:Inhibitor of the pro-sigma K processing machinery n=1 Tax=Caloramator quimbayensis TaxID=1147123 RepID=A0A1T4YB25_9CLOT|nr:pro-sigmaK processing inhibitor BofA family protein [Caloramator quimbayensis]SKA98966.1 inhibitor of the pro-sigma K processing machinery [Caloramator quimbayensis]
MVFDINVILYIVLIIFLGIVALSLKFKSPSIIKVAFKIVFAGVCIFLFNFFIGSLIHFTIPLNIVTASSAGLLGLPGIALLFILRFIIFP